MSNWILGNFGKGRSKSKTPDEYYPPCQSAFVNHMPHQPIYYNPPQNLQLQTPAYQHHHPVYNQQSHHHMQAMPISTCPHQWQSHPIQSPAQQSVAYAIHDHLPNNATIDHRPNDQQQQQNMVLTNQVQTDILATVPQATQQFIAMPTYQQGGNQLPQSAAITSQSSRFSDNSHYINQAPSIMQQQQQQQHIQHKIQMDEQHQRLQQHPQQQQHQHLSNVNQNHYVQQQRSQQEMEPARQRPQLDQQPHQQQQYQNNNLVNHYTNGDSGITLEVLCIMHEKDNEELSKLAENLKDELSKLGQELEVIRKRTPKYSVSKFKI